VKANGTSLTRNTDQALIQQATILAYAEPDRCDLTYLQNFLESNEVMGVPFYGKDGLVWGSVSDRKGHSPDLITLCPRQKADLFSDWVAENAITKLFCCLRFKEPSKIHGVVGYKDSKVFKITHFITTILASLILTTSIVVLYCIQSMSAKLGVIGAFNVLVSVYLVIFTDAKQAGVFAIAAAYVCHTFLQITRLTTMQFCRCSSCVCELR
jgi:hypothetical protein